MKHKYFLTVLLIMVFGAVVLYRSLPTSGVILGIRNLDVSTTTPSLVAEYSLNFQTSTAGNLGSLKLQFCSNSPIIGSTCVAPNGFSADNASILNQSGITGFSKSGSSSSNEIILTKTPAFYNQSDISINFDNMVNPSDAGTYYLRIQTFESSDASGQYSDYGGIAYSIQPNLTVNATVPPYLIFCTAVTIEGLNCENAIGNYIDLGELSANSVRKGTSQMYVTTNAELGYNITADGITLTSGNNVITSMLNADISRPGKGQFGLNFVANTAPQVGNNPQGQGSSQPVAGYNQANFFKFNPGDLVVSSPLPEERLFTASYIANIDTTQNAGIYASTITYICLANF